MLFLFTTFQSASALVLYDMQTPDIAFPDVVRCKIEILADSAALESKPIYDETTIVVITEQRLGFICVLHLSCIYQITSTSVKWWLVCEDRKKWVDPVSTRWSRCTPSPQTGNVLLLWLWLLIISIIITVIISMIIHIIVTIIIVTIIVYY